MRKLHKGQPVILRSGPNETVTLTICASEATMKRIATLMLFAERPEDLERDKLRAQGPLPWEDPEDVRFLPVPPTTEELETEATELISTIANLFTNGVETVKAIMSNFGVARLRDLPKEKLPQFIAALKAYDPAAETNNPDDLV